VLGVRSSTCSSPAAAGIFQTVPSGPATESSTLKTSPTVTSVLEASAVTVGPSAAKAHAVEAARPAAAATPRRGQDRFTAGAPGP